MKIYLSILAAFTLASCAVPGPAAPATAPQQQRQSAAPGDDPYLWLEEIESPRALDWVKARNAKTEKELRADSRYRRIERDLRTILLAKDRIPHVRYRNGYLYNFWQDEKSVRGVWRRTTLEEYPKASPRWEVLLDFDRLAKDENENWVYKGVDCLPPVYERCLVRLSRGGKDAAVVREFDVRTRAFVPVGEGGFESPEAKQDLAWIDRDTVLVATNFGEGSLTPSGYARTVRLWKRGQKLEAATLVAEGERDDMMLYPEVHFNADGVFPLISRRKNFYEGDYWLFDPASLKKVRLPMPIDAQVGEVFGGQVFVRLRKAWDSPAGRLPPGSVIAYKMADLKGRDPEGARPEVVFVPNERQAVRNIFATRDSLLLQMLDNINGRIVRLTKSGGAWRAEQQPLPDLGLVDVMSADAFSDVLLATYENPLIAPSVRLLRTTQASSAARPRILKSLPARFRSAPFQVVQREATSRDGTRVPYYVVQRRNQRYDGHAPTLMYGYGGFEVPDLPNYSANVGKLWLERGGVFVSANIRGGGEFGPAWHQAAIRENKQKSYDDFIAVAEDLVKRGVTEPARLGIMGGSNGGLLVASVTMQRPDLFKAVSCLVPLTDMLRFNQLLAGHSWVAEYGDPGDPKQREIILRFSPYQNLKKGVAYPKIFFQTSTKDDRVHPGHARKMAARMEEMGHDYYYYENIEGGHGAAANLEQKIRMTALQYTYLSKLLGVL